MNYSELNSAITHLLKTSTCSHCKKKYDLEDINILATTKMEGLFDIRCKKCDCSTLVTVVLIPKGKTDREHRKIEEPTIETSSITRNDVLDIKNFLTHFDGNFKKIFTKE